VLTHHSIATFSTDSIPHQAYPSIIQFKALESITPICCNDHKAPLYHHICLYEISILRLAYEAFNTNADQPARTPHKDSQNKPSTTASALSANSKCFLLLEGEQLYFGIYLLSLLSKNKNDILELLLIPMIHMSESLHSSFQARFFYSFPGLMVNHVPGKLRSFYS